MPYKFCAINLSASAVARHTSLCGLLRHYAIYHATHTPVPKKSLLGRMC